MNYRATIYTIIIFLGLGLLSLVIYKMFHKLYGKELLTRIDPLYGQQPQKLYSATYALLGDSRMAHWQLPDSILANESWINLGIDAQTSAQVLYRLNQYFKTCSANYSFIQVGINDLKAIGFYPNKREYITNNTIKNIESIINCCIENNSIPILLTIFPAGQVELIRKPFWNNGINEAIIAVNQQLLYYCTQKKVLYIDAYNLLVANNNRTIIGYQKDCLHLNEQGYSVLNSALISFKLEHNMAHK